VAHPCWAERAGPPSVLPEQVDSEVPVPAQVPLPPPPVEQVDLEVPVQDQVLQLLADLEVLVPAQVHRPLL